MLRFLSENTKKSTFWTALLLSIIFPFLFTMFTSHYLSVNLLVGDKQKNPKQRFSEFNKKLNRISEFNDVSIWSINPL